MNSNKTDKPSPEATKTLQGDALVQLVDIMKSVKTKGKEAKKNKAMMTDNNGRNIWYNWLRRSLTDNKTK